MGANSEHIAHIHEETGEIQTVKQHCENVARLAQQFACGPMKTVAYTAGLLHDIGKYQASFQRKITEKQYIHVDHSTCGAIAAAALPNPAGWILQYCIAGHHGGIPDGGHTGDTDDMPTLCGRKKKTFEDFSEYKNELAIPALDAKALASFLSQDCDNKKSKSIDKFAFMTRYCYSCLVDADSLDTEHFCSGVQRQSLKSDFELCLKKVQSQLNAFQCVTALQRARSKLQQQAYDHLNEDAEIYLMNMPTGSGKTLCSIRCALEMVRRREKKRIIYIIPYNSIISQTAETFEALFGEAAAILRHQSTYDYNQEGDLAEDDRIMMKQATENWDADFIITTAVQFFESIYSNRKSRLRKLHHMADSILVFDEAHMMPKTYLQPCLEAVAYLTRYLGSLALFLTATMPAFDKLIDRYTIGNMRTIELIKDKTAFCQFQRCTYRSLGTLTDSMLLEQVTAAPSSLVVLNRRKTAQQLYQACGTGHKYHLSTYMTAYDRARVIGAIRSDLNALEYEYPNGKDVPEERRIAVFSTSLIEAGVDLDFYQAFREIAGIDNILQTGGRCNREGKRDDAVTYIFEMASESESEKRPERDDRNEVTRGLLKKYNDISDPACIREYYDKLFFLHEDELESKAMWKFCGSFSDIPFRKYEFEIIQNDQVSIVIPQDEDSQNLIAQLKYAGSSVGLIRKLQKYTCSVRRYEFDRLFEQHVLNDYNSGIWVLENPDYYHPETGIAFEVEDYYI